MTFYSIPNTRRFLERVRTCSGEVRYLDSDGRVLDLKAAAVALTDTGLERFVGPIDKIEVFTQRAGDNLQTGMLAGGVFPLVLIVSLVLLTNSAVKEHGE